MKPKRVKAGVVAATCQSTGKGFCIRLEETSEHRWEADWAFAIETARAKREGYAGFSANGEIQFGLAYPGCPHCSAPSLVVCHCGGVTCHKVEARTSKCPNCGQKGDVGGVVRSIKVAGDR